jgi:hypothetical protein
MIDCHWQALLTTGACAHYESCGSPKAAIQMLQSRRFRPCCNVRAAQRCAGDPMHSWQIEDTSRLDVADKPLRNSTSSQMSWMIRRLHEVLQSQGVLPRQQVIFISDGGDTVRELPAFLHPHSEHILDWFHIAMRIEQLSQMARGFRGTYDCLMTKEKILKELERVKWFLWHGNVFRADETLTDLMFEIDRAIQEDQESRRSASMILKKLARALEEFATYIDNNAGEIVNYGARHRCGERGHGVAFDPLKWIEADRPIAARLEATDAIASRLQERDDIRQRIHLWTISKKS